MDKIKIFRATEEYFNALFCHGRFLYITEINVYQTENYMKLEIWFNYIPKNVIDNVHDLYISLNHYLFENGIYRINDANAHFCLRQIRNVYCILVYDFK